MVLQKSWYVGIGEQVVPAQGGRGVIRKREGIAEEVRVRVDLKSNIP